jgi:hypothetical protein
MTKWQISLRDFLVVVTLIAISICLVRVEAGQAILFSFLPGSYLAATLLRRDVRRDWQDLLYRVGACAFGGGLSAPVISIGTGWALGLMVQRIGETSLPLPHWFWLLILFWLAIGGALLGATYGAIETAILWGPRNIDRNASQ